MYPEFIIGYVMMGVLGVMLIAVIVLLCVVLKKLSRVGSRVSEGSYSRNNAYSGTRGTAICRNCATQFDSAHTVCPRCGTPR